MATKVKFTEGPAALDVPGVGPVDRGEYVEVDDDIAKQLIAQGWEAPKSQSKKESD